MNLKSAESAIYGAWLTGLVIGVLTSIRIGAVILFSSGYLRGEVVGSYVIIGVLVVILFALSYGVWRKNKICALLLAVYFISLVAWKTALWVQNETVPWGILVDFFAMLLCLNGARGVFAYHRIKQSETESGHAYAEQQ
ncbi:MAG TPA: hypothetical protein VJ810_03150 [Blastocatellia bacterium]|nr:hypothetical protein [Blastocatellia bacterium]